MPWFARSVFQPPPALAALMAACLVTAGSAQADITTGLVFRAILNETSGTSIADATGLHAAGTFAGSAIATTSAPAQFVGETAIEFNGTNQAISFADAADFEATQNMTFAAWVRTTTTGNELFVFTKLPASGFGSGYEIGISAGSFRTVMRSTGAILNWTANSPDFNDGSWRHVAWVVETTSGNAVAKGYIDGALVATSGSVSWVAADTGATPFYLGARRGSSQFWPGALYDARVYQRALSAGDVQELFEFAPTPPQSPVPAILLQLSARRGNQRHHRATYGVFAIAR